MLENLLQYFLIGVGLICALCVIVALLEVVLLAKSARTESKANTDALQQIIKNAPVATENPTSQPIQEVATTIPQGSVAFSPANTQTLGKKYSELPAKLRKYYDELVKYASEKVGVKQFKNDRYEEYKIGLSRLIRLSIKRGFVVAEFTVPNLEFAQFVADNKKAVKQSSTVLKIVDETSVKVAKEGIDLAERLHVEKIELKKQFAREKRKASKK